MNPHLWVGLPGLATDIQTVKQKIEFRMNMYELKESRQMKPKTFANFCFIVKVDFFLLPHDLVFGLALQKVDFFLFPKGNVWLI